MILVRGTTKGSSQYLKLMDEYTFPLNTLQAAASTRAFATDSRGVNLPPSRGDGARSQG